MSMKSTTVFMISIATAAFGGNTLYPNTQTLNDLMAQKKALERGATRGVMFNGAKANVFTYSVKLSDGKLHYYPYKGDAIPAYMLRDKL